MSHPQDVSVPLGIKLVCALKLLSQGYASLIALGTLSTNAGVGAIIVAFVLVDLVVVYGLLTMAYWGWLGAMVVQGVSLVAAYLHPGFGLPYFLGTFVVLVYLFLKVSTYEQARGRLA